MTTTLDRTATETTPTAAAGAIVVVGIDGSAAADAALLFALHEAQLRSAVLRVVTSHDLAPLTYGYAGVCDLGPMEDAMQAPGRELVATAQETVRAPQRRARSLWRPSSGRAAPALSCSRPRRERHCSSSAPAVPARSRG